MQLPAWVSLPQTSSQTEGESRTGSNSSSGRHAPLRHFFYLSGYTQVQHESKLLQLSCTHAEKQRTLDAKSAL